MSETMRVAIAAGGTAGHVNPALALAEELVVRGHEVRFVGQPTRLEATLVPAAGFTFIPIEVSGLDRARPWTALAALRRMRAAERSLSRGFAQGWMPDVVVGFGAYVEVPLVRWAHRHGVPVVLHEQNSVPGLANTLCARRATVSCVAFPAAEAKLRHDGHAGRVIVTGNPVRASVLAASRDAARASRGVGADETLVLVFGGSLGARHLNEGMVALKDELLSRPHVRVLHATGRDEYDGVVSALALGGDEVARWSVVPYIDAMGEALAASDLVVSRAGASSVAEIAAVGVPAVLVPYPLATADHQTVNASLLADVGAAVTIADDAIDTPVFASVVLGLVDDAERRTAMRFAAEGLGQSQAASLLADAVEAAAAHGEEVDATGWRPPSRQEESAAVRASSSPS